MERNVHIANIKSNAEVLIMHADDLFTASKVAKICSVDLKTIHNWVGRGEIESFRTPGGHLRFRRQDILDFLIRFHYPIPQGFAPSRSRIAILAEDTLIPPLKRSLSKNFEVDAYSDTVDALLAIGSKCPDLVLVNTDINGDSIHIMERLNTVNEALPIVAFGAKDVDTGTVEFIPTDKINKIKQRVVSILERR